MNGEHKILIILGMHRSGTSLFANWLNECGLNVGDRLLGSHKSNLKGHFEDLDFLEFHEKVLKDNCLDWKLSKHHILQLNDEHKKRAHEIVVDKHLKHRQWGWKEPRTCLLLDLWEEQLPNAHKIVIYRHYNNVVYSLLKRDFELISGNVIERFFKQRQFLFHKNKLANMYLNTWCVYNEQLIHKLQSLEDVLFINTIQTKEIDEAILIFLNNLGFQLEHKLFTEVFDEDLWNKKVTTNFDFKFEKQLIERAQSIWLKLELLQQKTLNRLASKY